MPVHALDRLVRRTQLSASLGTTKDFVNNYLYDRLSQVETIAQHGQAGGSAVAAKLAAYDDASRRTSLDRYADLAGSPP